MVDEITEVEGKRNEGSFMKTLIVVDASFLNSKEIFLSILASLNGVENISDLDQYVEWSTGWNFSNQAKAINDHLVSKGVPKDTLVIIKTY